MKLNKTLVAALVLGIGLTGCDNMVEDENKKEEAKTPVVEENEKQAADSTEKATDKKDSDKVEENEEANTEKESSKDNKSKEEKIEELEQAIFDLRSSQRAVELLFQISPESTKAHEDELNSLLDESNDLLEKAQDALAQLKAE